MSVYRTMIHDRTEFILRCDTCGWETTTIETKMLGGPPQNVTCPICLKLVDQTFKGDLPSPDRR